MKPVIGITPAFGENIIKLNKDYIKAISKSGGISLILTYESDIDEIEDITDGYLLTGGGDVDASIINEKQHFLSRDVCIKRDLFEIELLKRAIKAKKPVLGICRGMQLMCIASGGKIEQHIEGHFQQRKRSEPFHNVKILEKSYLNKIMNMSIAEVNSFHHQAVSNLPADILVCACAMDGVVEAIEHKNHPFYIGVQWHPEAMFDKNEEQKYIFEEFIKCSVDFRGEK